ncbi:MAG: hypothetical protein KGL35_07390 [Bradyrhizobium sp.]|nr:hypothetical protein [Bradyrhizobium sp.]
MIDSTKIVVLIQEVQQCAIELEEAAKLLRGQFIRVPEIYEAAAKRARDTLASVR